MTVDPRAPTRPLTDIPPELADLIRSHLGRLAEDMVEEIRRRVPEYDRRWDEAYDGPVREAIGHVVGAIATRIDGSGGGTDRLADFFQSIGYSVADEGGSLDALHAAVRAAGLVAWRHVSWEADRLRLSPRMVCALGEAILLFQEEVAAAAMRGHARARAALADGHRRRRRRLLDLLLGEPPPALDDVAEPARAAGWELPRTVAAVALHERGPDVARPVLPPDVLGDLMRPAPCLIVPDPEGPGRARLFDETLPDWIVSVGPMVPVTEAARSMRWARQALALARQGVLDDAGVIRCADHMSTLILFQDQELLELLAAIRMAPLAALRPSQRDRLAETLLTWLQSARNANEVAQRLHVHPQTVRYRLRQLVELFGERLHEPDPDLRFELELVLRARTLWARRPRGGGPA
ncbi:MAG TPA: helix-turn-helix domain-containing protein [Streptosporangiaceae bacterium]